MVSYIKNNVPFVIFVLAYAIVNLGLFISRAIQYKDSNMFYILARSCGIITHLFYYLLIIDTINNMLANYVYRTNVEFQLCLHFGFDASPWYHAAEKHRLR
jgi:hypothetical protein